MLKDPSAEELPATTPILKIYPCCVQVLKYFSPNITKILSYIGIPGIFLSRYIVYSY